MAWRRTFTGGSLAAKSMHLKVLDIGDVKFVMPLVYFAFFGIRITSVTLSFYYGLGNTGAT